MNQPVKLSNKIELLNTAGADMKKAMPRSILTEGAALLLCVLGVIIALDKLFDVGLTNVSYVVGVAASLIMLIVYRMERFRTTAVVGILVGVIGLGALHVDSIIYGALLLNARIVSKINVVLDTRYDFYTTTGDDYTAMLALEIGIPILLAILMGLLTVNVKRPLLLLCIALPLNVLCCTLQTPPLLLPPAMLMTAVVLTYAKRASGSMRVPKKGYKPPQKLVRAVSERIAIITAAIVVPISMVLATASQPTELLQGKQLLGNAVNFFSRDNLSKLSENIVPPELTFNSNTGIGGNSALGRTDGISFGGETHLRVKQTLNTPTYLRAFVGVSYDRNRWQARATNVPNKFRNMDKVFEEANFDPRMLSRPLLTHILENPVADYLSGETNNFEVENIGADPKYSYVPYLLRNSPSDNTVGYQGDGAFAAGSAKRAYEAVSLYDNDASLFRMPTSNMKDFIQKYSYFASDLANEADVRALYNEYVQAVYTAIPEDRLELLTKLGIRVTSTAGDIISAAEDVVEELDNRCDYNLRPGKTPTGKDFAEHFVFNTTQGYCAHFATAATLMLRAAGYPARYVEGYVLTQEDIDSAAVLGTDYVDIPDTNAHAWVELYDPLFGWFPYEATPAYADGVPEANLEIVTSSTPSSAPSSAISSAPSQPSSDTPTSSNASTSSNAASSDSSGAGGGAGQPTKIVVPKSAIIIMVAIALVALLVLLFRWHRSRVLARRERAFSGDTPSAVMSMYHHLNRILARYGYDPDSYIDLREYGKAVERHQNLPNFAHIIDVVLMVRFSPLEIERSELVLMREAITLLQDRINKGAGPIARIYYRYFSVII